MGLEVAAAFRERDIEVHIVAPANDRLNAYSDHRWVITSVHLHEEHGVVFHLQQTVAGNRWQNIHLKSGEILTGDLIVAAIGVPPHRARSTSWARNK